MPRSKAGTTDEGMSRQQRRTRRALLLTAARLVQEGRVPTMEEVAEAALVSRATIYRYFPSIDNLLAEAPLETGMQEAAAVFADMDTSDPVARIDRLEAWFHDFTYSQEKQLRLMLSRTLLAADARQGHEMVRRQNRRGELIEAALAPARARFTGEAYRKLCASLAVLLGTEAMIVCEDVLQLDRKQAREMKSWAVQTLVRAALEESRASLASDARSR